jgi:hypothetical protein
MRYLILLLLLTSCSVRKVQVNKEETKIDSMATIKIDSISKQENNITTINNTDEIEICPLIDTIPMIVNGITYKNVVLRHKKSKTIIVDTSKKITSKNVLKRVEVKKEVFKKEKTIDRTSYWWLLIPIVGVGIYLYYKYEF